MGSPAEKRVLGARRAGCRWLSGACLVDKRSAFEPDSPQRYRAVHRVLPLDSPDFPRRTSSGVPAFWWTAPSVPPETLSGVRLDPAVYALSEACSMLAA